MKNTFDRLADSLADLSAEREVQKALRRLRRESRVYVLQVVGCLLFWLLAVAFFVLAVCPSPLPGPGPYLLLLCLLCMVGGALTVPHAHSRALIMLGEQKDRRSIGPLLEAVDVSPEPKVQAIQSLLTVLLPQLQEGDACLLTRRQRRLLCDTLLLGDADRDAEYLLAIVYALVHIGDSDTRTCLRQVVQLGAVTEGQGHVWEAAKQSLFLLEARLEREQIGSSLLRASALSASAAELLRPTPAVADASPETLLRSAEEKAKNSVSNSG